MRFTPIRLVDFIDEIRGGSWEDEIILRKLLVRYSNPPLTWRGSKIIGIYIAHDDPGGSRIGTCKILFKSRIGRRYSKLLPLDAIKKLLAQSIISFWHEMLPLIRSQEDQPPVCPICGAPLTPLEMDGELLRWVCPEGHPSIPPSFFPSPPGGCE